MTARTPWLLILSLILLGVQTICSSSIVQAQERGGEVVPEVEEPDDFGKPTLACGKCGKRFPCCQLIPCKVTVCEEVKETRVKTCLTTVKEEREETYTVFVPRKKTRTFTNERCYLADEIKTRTITEKKCHVVHLPVVRECKSQSVERCKCGKCNKCADGKIASCQGKECGQQPCQCETAVIRDEKRSSETCEADVVIATTTRQIDYCVQTPKTKKCECVETYYELEPITKTRKVSVCVPKYVREPQEVTVCRTVCKSVMCCPCCAKKCRAKK